MCNHCNSNPSGKPTLTEIIVICMIFGIIGYLGYRIHSGTSIFSNVEVHIIKTVVEDE